MSLQYEIKEELINQGADLIYFIDISGLSHKQNKGYSSAILIGIILSPQFIQKLTNDPDYVRKIIDNNQIHKDEFHIKEQKTDRIADYIADYLDKKGYSSFSQSEMNINSTGYYDKKTKSTPLPHKTIALLAGMGWIGKHNLLVTPDYGSAISMCTVLTDAPLKTTSHYPSSPLCKECSICKEICSFEAINGNTWNLTTTRDELIDVNKCNTCLMCLALCPWTQRYMKKHL